MTDSNTVWQKIAIAMALAILGLQIVIGLEHLEGASTATKASIVFVMCTLAILPKFVEVAIRAKMYVITGVLLIAFVSWVAYSLPATIGRTGEVKATKVAKATATGESHKLLMAELDSARHRLQDATKDSTAKCKNPSSDNCKAARSTENERQSRVDVLLAEVIGTPASGSGDVASDLLAWALAPVGLSAEAIRNISTLAFAVGLDVIIWSLVYLGTTDRLSQQSVTARKPRTAINVATVSEPSPPKGGRKVAAKQLSDDEALADIRREVGAGNHRGVVEYGVRWGVSKGEASRRISSLETTGEIVCTRSGREKLITGTNRKLITAA